MRNMRRRVFRGKVAVVVGGGNTAVGDALYLSRICEKVYVVHRRDSFRADVLYLNALSELPNVELVLNSTVEAIRSTTDGESAHAACGIDSRSR